MLILSWMLNSLFCVLNWWWQAGCISFNNRLLYVDLKLVWDLNFRVGFLRYASLISFRHYFYLFFTHSIKIGKNIHYMHVLLRFSPESKTKEIQTFRSSFTFKFQVLGRGTLHILWSDALTHPLRCNLNQILSRFCSYRIQMRLSVFWKSLDLHMGKVCLVFEFYHCMLCYKMTWFV